MAGWIWIGKGKLCCNSKQPARQTFGRWPATRNAPDGGRRRGGGRFLLLEDQQNRVNNGARARYIARGKYDELRWGNDVDDARKVVPRRCREVAYGPEAP